MASTSGVLVDGNVLEVLRNAQLDSFVNKFVFFFGVRKFQTLQYLHHRDLEDIGMQQQQIRQLREQILKMSREMWNRSDPKQVYVAADQSTPVQCSIDEKALIPNEQLSPLHTTRPRRSSIGRTPPPWFRDFLDSPECGTKLDKGEDLRGKRKLNDSIDNSIKMAKTTNNQASRNLAEEIAGQTAPSTAAMSKVRGLSLDFPEYDDFDRAFDDGFSPSKIELPRAFGNDSNISNGSSSFRAEDVTNFIKASKQEEPLFDIRGNVLRPTPIEKVQAPPAASTARPILVAPTSTGVITMQLPDKLTSSQPRLDISMNHQTRPVSAVINPIIPTHSAQQQKANLPTNLIPELQHRLNAGNDMMRPRPASSIGIQNNALDNFNPHVHRPFSVVNVPTVPAVQPPTTIPCLVPTPAPYPSHSTTSIPKASTSQQPNPLQKALADELKGNLSRRPTSTGSNETGIPLQRYGVNQSSQPISQPPLQSQMVLSNQAPKLSQPQQVRLPLSVITAPIAPTPALQASPPTASVVPPAQSAVNPRPAATPVTTAPVKKASVAATSSTANGASSSQNVVTRRPTQTVHMSEEERRSKIIQDVTSALPAPSALLYGSSSTSALPSATSAGPTTSSAPQVLKERPTTVVPSQPHVTMPPKKTSEPILSSAVLQPTRLPSATTSVAKPASQPVAQSVSQPVRNPSPPMNDDRQSVITEKKPNIPSQSTNVPLFNITNSGSIYPQLNSYPNYGNGYQPHGYGMQYNPGYSGYTGYNPYTSGMGQLALTNSAVNSLPPLVPSKNRHSGTAQQLDDSATMELLGSQSQQPAAHPAPHPAFTQAAPTATSSTQSSTISNDFSIAERMKVLYKEADFTDSGNCDTMVMHCKGDTELALKLLKQNHLVQMGLASDTKKARQVLESRQYDLTAAANLLLG